jgi:riboflavin kinase / FMN adenylyltransferase
VQAAIDFLARLRGTLRFESVDALVEQMHLDVARSRDLTAQDPG